MFRDEYMSPPNGAKVLWTVGSTNMSRLMALKI